MFEKIRNAFCGKRDSGFGDGIVKIVKGAPLDHPEGPAWHATAYGPDRPCPMCREPKRHIRDIQDGILWENGGTRRFEPTESDVQCDCGILWGDEAKAKEEP
jgi:hypothetical protein